MFYKEKIELATKAMKENNIDCWIIAGHESATNTEPILPIISDHEFIGYTALIFNADGSSKCICTPIDQNGYIHADIFDDVEGFEVSFEESLSVYLKEKQPKVIAMNFSEEDPSCDGLSYGCYLYVEEALKKSGIDYDLVSAKEIVRVVKGIKSEREIALMKKACEITQEIYEAAKDFIREGVTCQDICEFFQSEVERRGLGYSWPKSYNPGVFAGYGCVRGHMAATDRVVKAGDLVNVDFGVVSDGYGSDMQRMYYLLKDDEEDAPLDAVKAFNAVRDTIKASADFLVPGKTGNEVDTYSREYLKKLGYPSWNSSLGHGIGAFAHDGGQLLGHQRPGQDRGELIYTPIAVNTCFTLEPSAETSCGTVGLEEVVVVRDGGCEFLSPRQKELYLIKGKK